ncbi:MAG: hypothetical protein WCC94_01220 [Candidatus Bathyarchaeia archaeon]
MNIDILEELEKKDWEFTALAAKDFISSLKQQKRYDPSVFFKDFGLKNPFAYVMTRIPLASLLPFYDQTLMPIPPIRSQQKFSERVIDVDDLVRLVNDNRVVPMLTGPHTHYAGIDFLDPILESAASGAIRSQILLRAIVGDSEYSYLRRQGMLLFRGRLNPEKYRIQEQEYRRGKEFVETTAASLYVDFRCLGYQELANQFYQVATINADAAYDAMDFASVFLTAPIVSGFCGFYQIVSALASKGMMPEGNDSTELGRAGRILSRQYDITLVERADLEAAEELYRSKSAREIRAQLTEIDESIRADDTRNLAHAELALEDQLRRFSELVKSIESTQSCAGTIALGTIGNADDPSFQSLFESGLLPIPVMSWDSPHLQLKILHRAATRPAIIQPGMPIRHPEGGRGTLGAFAFTEDGRITIMGAGHTMLNIWKARLGDPLLLEPPETEQGLTPDMILWHPRFAGLEEDMPVVLKKPIAPRPGMPVIKSGWRTQVTCGRIVSCSSKTTVKYRDGTARSFDDLVYAEIRCEPGDSGSVLMTYPDYHPVGLLIASDEQNRSMVYFHKMTVLCRGGHIRGVFCPISMPKNSSTFLRAVVQSLVPDGLFEQKHSLTDSDPEKIMQILGVTESNKERPSHAKVPHNQESEAQVSLGDKVLIDRSGRIVLKNGVPVGIIHAYGRDDQGTDLFISMPIATIETALNLEVLHFAR